MRINPLSSVVFCSALFVAASAHGQDFPDLSPPAKVVQTVGLTELSVEYSSPAVRGRSIFGQVVPYGELWRAGANMATKVSFDKEVSFGATAVPAGTYSLFVLPQKTGAWTVILNKNFKQGGTAGYDKALDAARVEVKPEAVASRERLNFSFANFTAEGGHLVMEWEKVRLSVPFKVGTDAEVAVSVKALEEGSWRKLNQAARYFLDQKKDFDAGLRLVELSIKQKEEWTNTWTKAQLLAAKGNLKDAFTLAQKTQELGSKNPQGFYYADNVKKALSDWKAKP